MLWKFHNDGSFWVRVSMSRLVWELCPERRSAIFRLEVSQHFWTNSQEQLTTEVMLIKELPIRFNFHFKVWTKDYEDKCIFLSSSCFLVVSYVSITYKEFIWMQMYVLPKIDSEPIEVIFCCLYLPFLKIKTFLYYLYIKILPVKRSVESCLN